MYHHELLLVPIIVNLFSFRFTFVHSRLLFVFDTATLCLCVKVPNCKPQLQLNYKYQFPFFHPSIQIIKNAGMNSSRSHKLHIGFSLALSGKSRTLSMELSCALMGGWNRILWEHEARGDAETSQWILMLRRIKCQTHSLCESKKYDWYLQICKEPILYEELQNYFYSIPKLSLSFLVIDLVFRYAVMNLQRGSLSF